MASSHCCLAKVMQLSSTCFPSHPGRLEMRGGAGLLPSLPWRLPPASTPGLLQSAEQGLQILCSHHPFSTAQLQEWESSKRGSGSLHHRETTLNPMSSKRRHELQCVLSVHLLGPSLLWDELHLENWHVSSLIRVLKDCHCSYFLYVYYMLGTVLFTLKALPLWARTMRSLRLSEIKVRSTESHC